ncbi:hypothetical protein ACFQGT_11900 [Natrialbaceae archaeon GCM10025810]|uniref:RPA family protein n=1 Tax=Halovalidus salilacus TaxID=3075124 RepID=UPI003615BA8A
MSADRPGREVAYRLFAAEYDDASLSHTESDEERAPNYVITPTGARVNRLFAVGTLTEVTRVNDEMLRARVVDPTGAFVVYAGQYQPDELAALERLEPPAFVAVTGKARTFQPDDSDLVYTSIRPESIATVDGDTRDRWVVSTAEQTLERIATYAAAADLDAYDEDLTEALLEAGVDAGLAEGIPLAQAHYGTTPAYLDGLRDLSLEAVEVVAGERDQVDEFGLRPGDERAESPSFAALADLGQVPELEAPAGATETEQVASSAAVADGESVAATDGEPVAATDEESVPATDEESVPATDEESVAATDEHVATESTGAADASASPSAATDEDSAEADSPDVDAVDEEPDSGVTLEANPEADAAEPDVDAEPTVGDVESTDDEGDELGDFDGGDFDGMYQMDDEEREELEEEFGAEFTTGAEVDEPGDADIDVPESEGEPDGESDSEPGLDEGAEAEPESESETELEPEPESEIDEEPEADVEADEPAADVDLEDYVIETMNDLDDGDGADRGTLIETVAGDTGASAEEVEETIQDALMSGRCYEPDDESLKAI